MTAPKPKLRWYQYSLRTLLVFVTLCALPCSWVAVKKQQGSRQAEAVAEIEKLGGQVEYDWQRDANGHRLPNAHNPGPRWLRPVLGEDFFQRVVCVSFVSGSLPVKDAELEHLKGMSQLQWLYLDGTQVTDAGLEHLRGMSHLQELNLGETQVTDAGVKELMQALPKCNVYR